MKLSDICIITENVPALTRFYENILEIKADINKVHTSFVIGDEGIAIYSKKAAEKDMQFNFSEYWGAGNFTIGINVNDVDKEYERLSLLDVEFINSPTTFPWGARSVHFRDPDGNIICFRTILNNKKGE